MTSILIEQSADQPVRKSPYCAVLARGRQAFCCTNQGHWLFPQFPFKAPQRHERRGGRPWQGSYTRQIAIPAASSYRLLSRRASAFRDRIASAFSIGKCRGLSTDALPPLAPFIRRDQFKSRGWSVRSTAIPVARAWRHPLSIAPQPAI